jgi:dynein heavy chain
MRADLKAMHSFWDVADKLEMFIDASKQLAWSNLDLESIEDGAKAQLKEVKGLHTCIRWSDAYKSLDKICKDFLATIPLLVLLGSNSMRPRHWQALKKATGAKEFVPPCDNENMSLGDLLTIDLLKFSNEVEEICDQAAKEEKMELSLNQMDDRWSSIDLTMTPYHKKDGDLDEEVPLVGISEEDFESLEGDQLIIQGFLSSRYLAQFEQEVNAWQKALFNVNELFLLVGDIQRTWSYLEPLFIHSEEVKRELPEDSTRFITIDIDTRKVLHRAYDIKNVKRAFNEDGLMNKLEGIQEQLDICKKSLADFLDGRRRQFPRYYFVSEADLLDILSNGGSPEKILSHIPKISLDCKLIHYFGRTSATYSSTRRWSERTSEAVKRIALLQLIT